MHLDSRSAPLFWLSSRVRSWHLSSKGIRSPPFAVLAFLASPTALWSLSSLLSEPCSDFAINMVWPCVVTPLCCHTRSIDPPGNFKQRRAESCAPLIQWKRFLGWQDCTLNTKVGEACKHQASQPACLLNIYEVRHGLVSRLQFQGQKSKWHSGPLPLKHTSQNMFLPAFTTKWSHSLWTVCAMQRICPRMHSHCPYVLCSANVQCKISVWLLRSAITPCCENWVGNLSLHLCILTSF